MRLHSGQACLGHQLLPAQAPEMGSDRAIWGLISVLFQAPAGLLQPHFWPSRPAGLFVHFLPSFLNSLELFLNSPGIYIGSTPKIGEGVWMEG